MVQCHVGVAKNHDIGLPYPDDLTSAGKGFCSALRILRLWVDPATAPEGAAVVDVDESGGQAPSAADPPLEFSIARLTLHEPADFDAQFLTGCPQC
jgi:hypothetical protein